jgi:predicted kinase
MENKLKLLMLKGLPGSGKSTWATTFVNQNKWWIRVNKDSIRKMMNYSLSSESKVLTLRDSQIITALENGFNVVVDDTNFHLKHEIKLREIAEYCHASFEEMKFDTPLEDCIKNDLKRLDSVGEKVIKKMWRQYLAPKIEPAVVDPLKSLAIICDLDGTLALHNGRSPYDTAKCMSDKYNQVVLSILKRYEETAEIIFVTGREERFRRDTLLWLYPIGFGFKKVFMRQNGDYREDSIVKQEHYDKNIKPFYNIHFVLDDRNRVVDMWRRNGLTCLQVAEGDF